MIVALGAYPAQLIPALEEALEEAWAWLIGQGLLIPSRDYSGAHEVKTLSRRARQLAQSPDPRRAFGARRLHKEALHPSVREDVWSQYHRANYDTAVFQIMRAVEIAVREAAGYPASEVAVALMRKAFEPRNEPLIDPAVEPAEREARAHLSAGAIGSYKNPQSHSHVAIDDPDEAAEIILLANHLLRIVDERRRALTGGP